MKPTDIVIDAIYRNSKYPLARYRGVLAPDGRTTFRITKSENDGMEGKYVVFEDHVPLNQDFWQGFSLVAPTESHHEQSETTPIHSAIRSPKKVLILLDGEFSVKELAEKNGVDYPIASIFLKEQESAGLVKRTRTERRAAKGKETQLFSKVILVPTPV